VITITEKQNSNIVICIQQRAPLKTNHFYPFSFGLFGLVVLELHPTACPSESCWEVKDCYSRNPLKYPFSFCLFAILFVQHVTAMLLAFGLD